MIALPLFTMIFAVMELALVFLISISLEDAASTMARQIRVGTITPPGIAVTANTAAAPNLTTFKQDLCQYILLVPTTTCQNQIQVDIQPFANFTNTSPVNPISGQTFNSGNLCYGSGTPGEVVLMRVYYLWPLLTPFLLNGLENVTTYTNTTGGGSGTGRWAAVSATEVFVNEPNANFTGAGVSC
jgi:Flp pilus assembly protein TadG